MGVARRTFSFVVDTIRSMSYCISRSWGCVLVMGFKISDNVKSMTSITGW